MVCAPRHDGWYAPLVKTPAKDIPADKPGAYAAGIVLAQRRDHATVVVDLGGGYGGPVFEHLKANDVKTVGYKGSESTFKRSKEGNLAFTNKRSAAYWLFREALDPGQPNGGSKIALPDDRRLLAGLTAPTFEVTPRGIQLEPKVKFDPKGKVIGGVRAKLGFSPDEADAVVMAWFEGPREATDALDWATIREQARQTYKPVLVNTGRQPLSVRARR